MKKIRIAYRNFIDGIKNLIKWFPVIWKDRDWDHDFIFNILEFKLKNQSKDMATHNFHTLAQYDSYKMNTCVKLIQKIREGYYETESSQYEVSEFHTLTKEEQDKLKGHEKLRAMLNIKNEWYDQYFQKHKSSYRQVLKQNPELLKDPHLTALYLSRYIHNRAKRILFDIMERHIECWWW